MTASTAQLGSGKRPEWGAFLTGSLGAGCGLAASERHKRMADVQGEDFSVSAWADTNGDAESHCALFPKS
jgi:hypothetical protein